MAVVRAVVGRQNEPARARQCHVKTIQINPGTLSGRPGTSKSVPNGSWERLGSVSGASRERLGESSVRPQSALGVHKGAQEGQRERPGASMSTPKRPKSIPRHVWKRKNRVFPARMIEKRCRCEFSTISVDFGLSQKDGEPSEVLRLPAKTEVRLFALRIDSFAPRNLGKRRKLTPRSCLLYTSPSPRD